MKTLKKTQKCPPSFNSLNKSAHWIFLKGQFKLSVTLFCFHLTSGHRKGGGVSVKLQYEKTAALYSGISSKDLSIKIQSSKDFYVSSLNTKRKVMKHLRVNTKRSMD